MNGYIDNFSNYYITSCGKVWNFKLNRFLHTSFDKDGYEQVNLRDDNGKQHKFQLHRLVLMAYVDNVDGKPQCGHRDENKKHNWLSNLEWCTAKENNNMPLYKTRMSDVHKKKILCVETGVVYHSINEAADAVGCSACNISNCLYNRFNTAGGYHWELV